MILSVIHSRIYSFAVAIQVDNIAVYLEKDLWICAGIFRREYYNDPFPDAVTFLKLHGDARQHPDQIRFLSKISSICFVLVTEENLRLIVKFRKAWGIFSLLQEVSQSLMIWRRKIIEENFFNRKTTHYQPGFENQCSTQGFYSTSKLTSSELSFSVIEDIKCIEQENIFVDEYCISFKEGLFRASKLKGFITGHKDCKVSTKESILPLQGDRLWKVLASHDREIHRQLCRGNDNGKTMRTRSILRK